MQVLAIGNSFSQDATRYLHRIAAADGTDLTVVNLYIGGCPLSKHYTNMLTDAKAYVMEFNGQNTCFFVSLQEALTSREWDFVTLQQASHQSFDYQTYQPYLDALAAYVRKFVPKAKLLMHQTWAYEQDSDRLLNMAGYTDRAKMFADVRAAYLLAADAIDADGIIPSGALMEALTAAGIEQVHRDTFHAGLGLSRYAMGLLWYGVLTGADIASNTFCELDRPATAEEIAIAKRCVASVIAD